MQMQLSSEAQIPDGMLAAIALRNEKPRLGVPSWNPALHQGIDASNSTIVLGLQSTAALNGIGSRSTGKERDTESGNDYFGARYYNSATGRFLSPDWSAKEEPVPYAKLDNPQSLNLYSYVLNNPLSHVDPDGHETEEEKEKKIAAAARAQKGSDAYDQKKTNISNMQIFHSGSDKCNEFVSDTVKSATGTRPVVEATGKIATAAQMADPNVKIVGLSAPEPMSNAKPGDVVAQIHGTEPNGNVDAHVGIIVGLPTANSQGANCFGRRLRGRANRG
jgi:RHS repeat-associated protein